MTLKIKNQPTDCGGLGLWTTMSDPPFSKAILAKMTATVKEQTGADKKTEDRTVTVTPLSMRFSWMCYPSFTSMSNSA